MSTPNGARQRPAGSLAELRRYNRELVIAELSGGPATQQTLTRTTGLSATTVRALVRELLQENVVEKRGEHHGSRGRPSNWIALASVAPSSGVVAGIICGHHTARVMVSTDDGLRSVEARSSLSPQLDAPGCLHIVDQLLETAIADLGVESATLRHAVIGLPGLVDPTGLVLGAGERWNGLFPAHLLADRLGVPTTLENDTNLAAIGEAAHGAGRGRNALLYIKISTGIGAALVLDGRLAQGVRRFGSFLGHTRINPDGRRCKCGGIGCLETEASGTAALMWMARRGRRDPTTLDLRDLMAAGDPELEEFRRRSGRLIGRTLADAFGVLAPDTVIIGGLLAGERDDDTLIGAMRNSALAGMPWKYAEEIEFRHADLGVRAESVGAAVSARQFARI